MYCEAAKGKSLTLPFTGNDAAPVKSIRLNAVLLLAGLLASHIEAAGLAPQVTNVNGNKFDDTRLTVVTYNMLHGFCNRLNDDTLDERLALLEQAIAADPPDILILQEASVSRRHGNAVDTLRNRLNADPAVHGFSYNSAQLMGNGSALVGFFEGSAILSRFRILSSEGLAYASQALLPPERRVALRVSVAGTEGPITVVGTHLTNTEARRGATRVRTLQARELAAWITAGPPAWAVVLGGDFNDVPGSPTIGAILTAGGIDLWAAFGMGDGLTGLNGTVRDPSDNADERIDYLFTFGRANAPAVVSSFLPGPGIDSKGTILWTADHIGVRAVIDLTAVPADGRH
jgi:endonuclease/exonuclease/phosphatase family metal-dependent hydrolase